MAQQVIGIGTTPGDGTGDPARTAFDKVNDNFNEVYGGLGTFNTPTISGGALVLNMANMPNYFGAVSLNANLGAGSISITNAPTGNWGRVVLSFVQTAAYTIDQAAFSTFPGTVYFTQPVAANTDSTPLLVVLESNDSLTTWFGSLSAAVNFADIDGTVATAQIATAAVTYAKIQDVSATDKVLGRSTAGSGDVEEIDCTAAGRALIAASDAAAQRAILDPVPQVVNAQTGTTYTLLMADKGKLVTCSNGSAVTVTVETATATWASGDRVDLLNIGAGAVTISGSGVTINKAADQTAVLAQGKGASLIFISDSVAWLVGGMGAA